MDLDADLEALRLRIEPMERLVQAFANSLPQPHMVREDRGFRYESGDVRHFCLIKAVRVVSTLNASIDLARNGYSQEIGTLMRILTECTTHIEFVLDRSEEEEHQKEVERYLKAFFADSHRDRSAEIIKAQVPQGFVHARLGKTLNGYAAEQGDAEERVSAVRLYSNIYRIYSNYVHVKYPETMDLYGGRPGRFHLRGMRGTPKDAENVAVLETFVTSALTTFIVMVQGLDLYGLVQKDELLTKWYRETFRE